jgi:hypothetical protein
VQQPDGAFEIQVETIAMVTNVQNFLDACWLLLAVYYTYCLKYPKEFVNSLVFLQKLCGITSDIPKSAKAQTLFNELLATSSLTTNGDIIIM